VTEVPEPRALTVPAARLVFSTDDRARILELIDESLQSGSLTLGPHTRRLEAAFAARHGSPHAVAVSSGTSAIEIVLRALDVGGREVIVPANTFFATAAAVIHAGGRPRFADVSADTLALTAATVDAALTRDTAAVVMVHIGGLVAPDVVAIRHLCEQRGLLFVEDAAHAHGSSYAGRPAGTFGIAGTFSFYPTKVITAGEGGMIVTADDALRDEALIYRDQGKAGFHGGEHVRLGYAWRLSELQAAVAAVHVARLDEFIAVRTRVARGYDDALAALGGLRPLPRPDGAISNYYKYIALLDAALDRSALREALAELGVFLSGEVYRTPLHREPVFAGLAPGPLPVAEDVCSRHICLPVHSDMTDSEVDHVVTALYKVLG
jgi:perosamine synthetase